MTPHRHEHLGRRAFLKGTLATAAGGLFANWGPLRSTAALAEAVKNEGKRCILLWMNGGASQFETFDMKVGRATGGLFRPISTNLPGMEVCELLPRMSQMMDKLTVIRSMRTSEIDHPGGIHLMHTAYSESADVKFPEFGAVIAKYLGDQTSDLPGFVKISSQGSGAGGFLGPRYGAFNLDHDGNLPPFSGSPLSEEAEQRRHELRTFLEETYAGRHAVETVRMHREGYEAARRLDRARQVFNIEQEWPRHEKLYGDSKFGRRCLLARKLIESGVPFVEVGQSGYDTHADNFEGHKGLLPPMDHAWAGLLTDLAERGMLEKTLVVWMGEIGRTPNINNRSGRDHYVRAWSTALAGGGVKGGLVFGETDEEGRDVKDSPVTEGDFFATIYQALGINPLAENYAGTRPIPVAPFGSKAVKELLA